MNIPFTQTWPDKMGKELAGTPTYFISKIWGELYPRFGSNTLREYFGGYSSVFGKEVDNESFFINPKSHTIRENKKGRYKAGVTLQPYVWTGKPYHSKQFYFCPKVKCVSTQRVEIKRSGKPYDRPWVLIDGMVIPDDIVETLAINDGFRSTSDFFKYFDSDFTGDIIHWTDLRY